MDFRKLAFGAVGALALFSAGAANAALVLAGSWRLTDGPSGASTAYSAQEIAAQLFGGAAADYMISTAGPNVADINMQAHYLIFAFPGSELIDNQASKEFIPGYGITAYGFDAELALESDRFINYAFREDASTGGIPEPATWALMIGGFGATGVALRRRRPLAA